MYCHYSPCFFKCWTLLCGVYRPYGIIFCYQLYNFYCDLFSEAVSLQCTSELQMGHQRLCLVWVLLRLVRLILWYVLQIAHAALLKNVSRLAGSTELAMSVSGVSIIV